jgi:signal transduction histidine kinase
VLGHENLLSQCLLNLLQNAVKFVARGRPPKIRIWTEDRGGRVRVWVEDNGIGIAKDQQERIFGLFQRLHRQDAYPGTGVGLAIVRKAVERMGGTTGVESEPGKGSRFWLELAQPVS